MVEPWLGFLGQRFDSYVFQDISVIEIVEDLFADYAQANALAAAGRWELADRALYRKRSLTTQREESDLASPSCTGCWPRSVGRHPNLPLRRHPDLRTSGSTP